jgi:hypothetical protein
MQYQRLSLRQRKLVERANEKPISLGFLAGWIDDGYVSELRQLETLGYLFYDIDYAHWKITKIAVEKLISKTL